MIVRVATVEEFLAELGQDRDLVHRDIIRVTRTYSSASPVSHALTVVATAVVGEHVLRLEAACGELWGEHFDVPDRATKVTAADVEEELLAGAVDMGLSLRPGVYGAAA